MNKIFRDGFKVFTWNPDTHTEQGDLTIYTGSEYEESALYGEIEIQGFINDKGQFDEIISMVYPNFPIGLANEALIKLMVCDLSSEEYWVYNTKRKYNKIWY